MGIMKPGHTFTIEPMINEGECMFICDDVHVLVCDVCVCMCPGIWRDALWPDEWTAVTTVSLCVT